MYQLGSAPLQIPFDAFQVPNTYIVNQSHVEVYLFTGTNPLESKIDLTCDCLVNIVDLDWISLEATSRILTVQTSNSDYVGLHKVVLV